jgi:hypothetical protein
MCCFSGPRGLSVVEHVKATRIFARGNGGRQRLVYAMEISAREPVAMILPLPVPKGTQKDDVRFISLAGYPAFFDAMNDAFKPLTRSAAVMGAPQTLGSRLTVHRVGKFVASFVPTLGDFGRLDPRFRLAEDVFDHAPDLQTRGFAVFQLATGLNQSDPIHPMAFDFPRADSARLFFPTLHVHDGILHPEAEFDHELFLQTAGALDQSWTSSERPVETVMEVAATQGIVKAGVPLAKRALRGRLPNEDHYAVEA